LPIKENFPNIATRYSYSCCCLQFVVY